MRATYVVSSVPAPKLGFPRQLPRILNLLDVLTGSFFPGVGSAESAVDTLDKRGLSAALKDFYATGKPLLGICLGCQILLEYTEEGNRDCLGLINGEVLRFEPEDH